MEVSGEKFATEKYNEHQSDRKDTSGKSSCYANIFYCVCCRAACSTAESDKRAGHDAEQNHFSKWKTGFVLAGLDTQINDFCGSVKMIVHDITPYSFVIRQLSCFEW